MKAYSVNWGSSVNSQIQTAMPSFYAAITASNMYDWLGEYSTAGLNGQDGAAGSNQTLGHGSSGGSITITPSITSSTIDDSQIQTELNAQITAGKLPAPDDNAYYAINFPKGVTITQGGSSSCVQFCAYHGTFKRGNQNVYYGVLPSLESGTGCDLGCGSNSNFVNNATSVASHELVEATTDAEVGVATVVGRPLAWYNTTDGEIGDICNALQGTITDSSGKSWVVQQEFDNATNTCITTKTVTSDFSISVSPLSASVVQGSSTSLTVSTTNVSGSPTVTLSVSGLPSGVSGTFSPATVTAGGSSTLTLTASASATTGTASLSIKGTSSATNHSASASLTVTSSGTGGGAGGGTGGGTGGGGGSDDVVLVNGQAATNLSGALDSNTFYKIDVPAGATSLVFTMSGGTGDADMYLKFGAHPSTFTYDCRPYISGNNETCTVAAPQAGTYYVMLNGYAAYSGVSLLASYSAAGGDPVLEIGGASVTGLSGALQSQKYWQITVKVAITGSTSASNDADLYVRIGSHPTTSTYNCRPYKTGSNETCTFSNPAAGTYYVMVRGYTAYSGVTLSAK